MKRILSLLPVIFSAAHAQTDTLVLHEFVGKVIDSTEKIRYGLFYEYSRYQFSHAYCTRGSDSVVVMNVVLKDSNRIQRVLSMGELERLRRRIDGSGSIVANNDTIKCKCAATTIITTGNRAITGRLIASSAQGMLVDSLHVSPEVIRTITFGRKKDPVLYVLGGGLIGAVSGVQYGRSLGDKRGRCDPWWWPCFRPTAEFRGTLHGIYWGIFGGATGYIIGRAIGNLSTIRIPIYGKREKYESVYRKLKCLDEESGMIYRRTR